MNKIQAVIVADSVDTRGNRITSFLLTYPRFIHSELMTHRMFSRNSASSRAIPFEKMVKMIEEDPFIPIAWQKDHKGMQGSEYITEPLEIGERRLYWKECAIESVKNAKNLNALGVTKQLCNRLLEPFMWHTTLVTATELKGFFELRCPKYTFGSKTDNPKSWRSKKDAIKDFPDWITRNDLFWYSMNESQAEIHIQALAESMLDAMNESTPKQLKAGDWHIPFGELLNNLLYIYDNKLLNNKEVTQDEREILVESFKLKISTARCARLSYNNHNGEIDYQKDIELHDRLLRDHHMSPFEHCATVMFNDEYTTFVKGRLEDYTSTMEGYNPTKEMQGWCNNFKGFIPYRYLIENNYGV